MGANTPRVNPRLASQGSDFNPGTMLVGFYQPLNTPVHRVPLWLKGTLFFGLFLLLAVTSWQVALVALVASTLCALWAGVPASQLWLVVRLLRVYGSVRLRRGCYRDHADRFLRFPCPAGEHSPAGSD